MIFNQPSSHYFFDKAYIKGLVPDDVLKILVGGNEARLFNGEFEAVIDFQKYEQSCTVEVELLYGDGTTSCSTITFNEPYHPDFVYGVEGFNYRKETLFETNIVQTISLNGAALATAKGSLMGPAHLSITTLRAVDIPPLDAGMENVTANHAAFRFLPDGTVFGEAATLHIPYDAGKIPEGYTEQDIRTYYFDEQSHHWVALAVDTVLTLSGEIVSKTVHFTDYINGIIRVPESPEVEAYNSTSMKGIKAANPTTALNLINPPQANNSGSASLGYPINIPVGRGGVQPQLSISYNSGGGNGWMGLGWNLSLPMISIETRWGVPRYDPNKETETYTMDGQQLTPVAHRAEFEDRTAGDKQFFPRVEGAFNRVIRHGTTPMNYWWEVTDKSGTRYFYGGSPAGLESDAVLRDDEKNDQGNIAYWCLREVRDLNGNNVRYHYTKVADVGVAGGTVPGYQIYIEKITYTGYQGGEGPYSILFTRDRETGEAKRSDISITGNFGFKQVTADLLTKLEVQFEGKNIRSYQLNYKTGAFHKTLLDNISEFDAAGDFFVKHEFEYYNEVNISSSFVPLDEPESWNVPDDGIDGGLIVSKAGFNDNASLISGNKSNEKGFGMTVTAGFNDGQLTNKSNTLGGSFGYSDSETDGRLYLLDINGDGLADKIMAGEGGFRYRANESGPNRPMQFSDEWIEIRNVGEFFKEKSKTTNVGFEAQGGFGNATAFVGTGKSKTTSVTSVYFSDVNGDQLPDLVKNGIVHFNHYDPETGIVTFLPNSEGTPNPINLSGGVAGDIFEADLQELEDNIDANPLHDMVRVWRAPYAGKVSVTAPVRLVDTGVDAPNADGVTVTIQRNGNAPLWSQRIQEGDFAAYTPTGVGNIDVSKGDRIYFRVQSVFNGESDEVHWSPVIVYDDADLEKADANGKRLFRYSAEEDFILTAPLEIAAPIDGTIRIESVFKKPQVTDDLRVAIVRKSNSGDVIEFERDYAWDSSTEDPINLNLSVSQGESFVFSVTSQTNVDWTALEWRPNLYYTASADPGVPDVTRNGEPLISYYAVPKFSLFARALMDTASWVVHEDVDSIDITPSITVQVWPLPTLNPYTGELVLSVKKQDTLVSKHTLSIQQGQLVDNKTFRIAASKDDTLYFEYHTTNEQLAEAILHHDLDISMAEQDSTVEANLFTTYLKKTDIIYGPLYRHWGFFGYNGNRGRADEPIREADLKLSSKLEHEYHGGDVDDPNDLDGNSAYDPSRENFIMLFARGSDNVWAGYDEHTWLNALRMRSSRMGDDDLLPAQAIDGGAAMVRAVNKISKSESSSFSGGVGFSIGNASANTSTGSSRLLSDLMDLNADGYPDVVTEKGIQFTDPTGKLEDGFYTFATGNVQHTSTSSVGASAGGFVRIEPKGGTVNSKHVHSDVGAAKVSGVISVNYGEGDNKGNFSWQDINGDGLPDRVHSDGMVELNLGYKLAPAESWSFQDIQASESESVGGGLGFSIGTGSESASISGGIGLSRSDNETTYALQDINGDGLTDELVLDGSVRVKLNTGNGFASPVVWPGAAKINESSTTGESANAAFTGCITLGIIPVKICFNPSGNVGRSMSRDENRITDIDGDGNADFLISEHDGDLKVKSSTIGRTNMLRTVHRPLGASFTVSFSRKGNTYEMPNSAWVMDSVKVFDGFAGDGPDMMLTTYQYEGGLFDRHEREFYGFNRVIINTHDTNIDALPVYTSTTQTYNNDNYYERGLLLSEVMTDSDGNRFMETENVYQLKNVSSGETLPETAKSNDSGNAFPALTETQQKFYEGQTTVGKSTKVTYGYDVRGNVTTYVDFGDEGDEDDISSTITYHALEDLYVLSTPRSIMVTGSGVTYRKRESVIDPNTGDVTQIKIFLSEEEIATHDLAYDEFGNLNQIINPKNSKEQRLRFDYEYDEKVHTYRTRVTNSHGYSSESTYDFRFGQVLTSSDLNDNKITYELDDLGRVKSVTGPYEKGATKTIEFEYHPEAAVPWALTKHHDPVDPQNKLQTAIFVDGLGRILQTKKDAAIFTSEGKADTEVMSVSGRVYFDALGRSIKAFYPVTASAASPGAFVYDADAEAKPTLTTYDVLNRSIAVTLPDLATTTTEYGFGNDREGENRFMTTTTDASGKQTEQFTDVRGKVTAIKNVVSGEAVWTSFRYNAIGEQTEAMDDMGNTVFSVYDILGRRVERRHPDAGTTTFKYDLAGNLIELVTANLAKEGLAILYSYDFERLTEITYPQNIENNVKYTYGEPGASDNRAGRIVLQEDASGAQEFFYGPLGEVVKNIRTVVIPQHDEQTFVTEWEYDTWNRLLSMTYADGEKVTYAYNQGGLLRSMSGKKKNASYAYVDQLGYDKFEQRVFLAYGNGTKMTYTYENDRRRIANMTASTAAKRLFMDNTYTYDKVNNVLTLENKAPIPSANLMGGASQYSFEYDDLHRLVGAQGNFQGANDAHTYTMALSYNTVGGIIQKSQHHERKGNVQKKTTYDAAYAYSDTQPHAPVHIGEQTYTYDANGNQTGWTSDVTGQRRQIMWDEDNRIRSIYDNGSQHHYVYDASGVRVLKGKSAGQRIFVNGQWKAGSGQMGNYTIYVNPYLVLRSGGYTKHYYIEGQRIVSKLGGGWDNNGKGPLRAGGGKVDFVAKRQRVFDGIVKNLKFLGADGQILTAGKSGKIPPGQINGAGTGNISEAFRYFYHPDHLGSTSYVTDASGEVYQHLEYFAFGETFVEEHSNTDRTPYLFNGKELDEETALYYYGARYYDPRTSVWASVDPLAEKYSEWNPYAYAFNNPLRFIDPDGRGPDDEITDHDRAMAKLAADVYQTENGQYKPDATQTDLDGWKLSEMDFGITLTKNESGLNSAVYQKEVNGEMQYVYVTQGSDFNNGGNDWSENYKQSMGQYSAQYDQSVKNAKALQEVLGDRLSFAGHSLGGGLASANALATGLDATTFNAAGISNGSRSLYGLDKSPSIKAFVVHGEIVSVTQGVLGLKAEGTIHKLPARYVPFIPFTPPQVRAATAVINLGLSAYNHTMGSVMNKMGIE